MNTTPRLIKSAPTARGFAIGIIETVGKYSVIRINAKSQYITISIHDDYESARTVANREWAAEVTA